MLKVKLLKMYEKFNFKKHSKFFSILIVLIIFGLFLPRGFVQADLVGFIMDRTIFPVLYAVFASLLQVAALIAWIAAYTLNATLNPAIMNNVFASRAIYGGWTLIRDISNLLFLLLMLLVAFGTIVQSSKYNIKNSLLKLILAIFLINFSNVIAGAIIDFGNILMYGILKMMCSNPNTCFQDYFNGLMEVVNKFKDDYNLLKLVGAVWSGINSTDVIGAAIATIYTFIYSLILLALALFLMVRTAALAMLLILAPFAYFGEVMPGMEKVSSKWWDSIWSYSLFGPVFALMLYIAGELAKITIAVPPITDPNLGWYSGTIVIIISNILPLLFLLGIIPVTKTLGLAGTETILKHTNGLRDGIAGIASDSWGRYVARGASAQGMKGNSALARASRGFAWVRRRGANFSPTAIKAAIKAKQANDARDYDVATGKMRNKIEDPFGVGKKYEAWQHRNEPGYKSRRPDYEQRVKDERAESEIKLRGSLDTAEIIDAAQNALEKGIKPEIHIRDLKTIAAGDGMDDFLDREIDKAETARLGHDVFYGRGAAGLKKYLDDTFSKSGTGYKNLDEDAISKLADNIHNSAKKNGNVSYAGIGTARYDAGMRRTVHEINAMTGVNPITGLNYVQEQEDAHVKAGNKMDPKDLKKSSFLDATNNISAAGERILRDMKGKRADRIKTMDRERIVEIDRALEAKYGAAVAAFRLPGMTDAAALRARGNPGDDELADVWETIKADHNLP